MEIKQLIVPHKYRSKYGQNQGGELVSGLSVNIGTSNTTNISLDDYVTKVQLNNRLSTIEYQYTEYSYPKNWIDSSINTLQEQINNVTAPDNHVMLTEQEYNALPTKDEHTVYLIKGSHYQLISQTDYDNLASKDPAKIYLITS